MGRKSCSLSSRLKHEGRAAGEPVDDWLINGLKKKKKESDSQAPVWSVGEFYS